MFRIVLLFLFLSGLQAAPIAVLQKASSSLPDGYKQDATHPDVYETVADGFRQGTEPSRRFLVDLNTGLVKEHISEMDRRAFIPPSLSDRRVEVEQWLADDVPVDVPVERNGGGWVRVEEPSAHLPHGFRQGTEPKMSMPDGFSQGTEPKMSMPDGFSQGTEPKMSIPEGFSQGTEPKMSMPEGFSQGTEPKMSIPEGFSQGTESKMSMPEGFSQGTESKMSMPEGFSQGTEPKMKPQGFKQGIEPMMLMNEGFRLRAEPQMSTLEGFRQGTEPSFHIPEGFRQRTEPRGLMSEGFRQGTEPLMSIPVGFRQGTEPSFHIPEGFRQRTEPRGLMSEGFRQGTEPLMSIPVGFRQGTEPSPKIPEGFKAGTEPSFHIPEGFREGTEPVLPVAGVKQRPKYILPVPVSFKQEPDLLGPRHQPQMCKGEILSGRCYEFNPTRLAFQDARVTCRDQAPNAELASIPNSDVHTSLVSMVTNGGNSSPVLTWIGAVVEDQRASWVDGSEWGYSDWMPGQPGIPTDDRACVEMFKIDESWWTANDCDLKRASICSYPIAA